MTNITPNIIFAAMSGDQVAKDACDQYMTDFFAGDDPRMRALLIGKNSSRKALREPDKAQKAAAAKQRADMLNKLFRF